MVSTVGFEKLTVRINDGTTPAIGKNLFVINGKKDEGATATAKISGLAIEPVKTYGSNKPYHISAKGVGDAKADFDLIDIPFEVQNAVLGFVPNANGVVTATAETEAPSVAILMEDTDIRGNRVMFGFYDGKFSKDSIELTTGQGKAAELPPEQLSYTVGANDEGEYYDMYVGKEDAGINEVLTNLGMKATTANQGV